MKFMINNFCFFLKNNVDTIKDMVNIVFWIVTSFVAVFTYKNAKKTLFNPIKTEVTKEQLRLLTNFINKYSVNGLGVDTLIDYMNIIKITIDMYYLNEFNKDEENSDKIDLERIQYCKEKLGGLIEVTLDNNKRKMQFNDGNYETTRKYLNTNIIKSKEKENIELLLQRVYFTSNFQSFHNDLYILRNNPFIPNEIKSKLNLINDQIIVNLQILYELLEKKLENNEELNYYNIWLEYNNIKKDDQNI